MEKKVLKDNLSILLEKASQFDHLKREGEFLRKLEKAFSGNRPIGEERVKSFIYGLRRVRSGFLLDEGEEEALMEEVISRIIEELEK